MKKICLTILFSLLALAAFSDITVSAFFKPLIKININLDYFKETEIPNERTLESMQNSLREEWFEGNFDDDYYFESEYIISKFIDDDDYTRKEYAILIALKDLCDGKYRIEEYPAAREKYISGIFETQKENNSFTSKENNSFSNKKQKYYGKDTDDRSSKFVYKEKYDNNLRYFKSKHLNISILSPKSFYVTEEMVYPNKKITMIEKFKKAYPVKFTVEIRNTNNSPDTYYSTVIESIEKEFGTNKENNSFSNKENNSFSGKENNSFGNKSNKSYEIVKDRYLRTNNTNARELTIKIANNPYLIKKIWFKSGKNMYIFTYQAIQDDFYDYDNTFYNIINSIKIY